MPGKHDPKKKYISFSIKRELWYKLTQYAKDTGYDRTSVVVEILEEAMQRRGVRLSAENQEKVEEEIKATIAQRRKAWPGYILGSKGKNTKNTK